MQKRLKNTDLVNQPRLSFFDKCWGTTVGHQISTMKRKTKTKNEWTKNMVKKMYRWNRMPMYTVHLAISARIYLSLHRDNYLCVHLVISVNTSTCFSKDAENLTTYGYMLWCSQIVCTCHYSLNTIIAFYSVIEWSNFAVSVWSMACQATTLSHFT